MDSSSQIKVMRQAFEEGETLSPLRAWEKWHISSSSYHRIICRDLKRRLGMRIGSKMITEENGIRHSIHRLMREAA
jgi:hypothetical protein